MIFWIVNYKPKRNLTPVDIRIRPKLTTIAPINHPKKLSPNFVLSKNVFKIAERGAKIRKIRPTAAAVIKIALAYPIGSLANKSTVSEQELNKNKTKIKKKFFTINSNKNKIN